MIHWPHRTHQPIGLDLGADCIKMIQIEASLGGPYVRAASQFYFPADLDPQSPQRRDLAIQAVRRMHREGGFRGRHVVSAIADDELVIKTIRVPEGNPDELPQVIHEEAAKRLPFEAGEARVEYLDAGRVQQGNEVCREIIILGVSNRDIDSEIELLGQMGLEPVALEVGPCALFRSSERFLLRDEDRDVVTLLVDVGATTTKLVIGHGPEIAFIKTIACGSRDINQAVARSLDLSLREAINLRESLARQTAQPAAASPSAAGDAAPEDLAGAVVSATEPVLAQLAKEISLCLRYHAVTFRGYRPAVLQLSGGEAHHPLTIDFVKRALGMNVVRADPFRNINTSHAEIGQSRRKAAPCWMLSTGLALRGLRVPAAAQEVRS